MNRIVLIGRLTGDPEAKVTPSGINYTKFRVAVDREDREKTAFFVNVTAWRQAADFIAQYVGKGRMVSIDGKLDIREYQKDDGGRGYSTEITADHVKALDRAPEHDDDGGGDDYQQEQAPTTRQQPQQRQPAPQQQQNRPVPARAQEDRRAPVGAGAGGQQRNGGRRPPPPANDAEGFDDFSDPFAE